MAYFFYLDKVQLPVTPSKLQLRIKNQNKTLQLINEGEINILKTPGLTEVSFSAMLPNVKYPFASYPNGFKDAMYYTELLKRLKSSSEPFYFIVTRMTPAGKLLFDTELKVTLEEYTITEDAKQGMDLIVDIQLKQYREYGTQVLEVVQTNSKGPMVATIKQQRPITKQIPNIYTVKPGDTLWKICKKELGNGDKYAQVAKINAIANPNVLKVGQVIKLG